VRTLAKPSIPKATIAFGTAVTTHGDAGIERGNEVLIEIEATRATVDQGLERCVNDIYRLEATKGFPAKSSLIRRLLTLPPVVDRDSARTLTNLPSAARIRCFDRLAEGPDDWLAADDNAETALWRRRILTAGGLHETLCPARHWMARHVPVETEILPISVDVSGITLSALLHAYARVKARFLIPLPVLWRDCLRAASPRRSMPRIAATILRFSSRPGTRSPSRGLPLLRGLALVGAASASRLGRW